VAPRRHPDISRLVRVGTATYEQQRHYVSTVVGTGVANGRAARSPPRDATRVVASRSRRFFSAPPPLNLDWGFLRLFFSTDSLGFKGTVVLDFDLALYVY
jgi:hypothetical protein